MRSKNVVLGLGSNLGVPLENLRQALMELRRVPSFLVLKVSPIYESAAQLKPGAPESWNRDFLNAAVLCEVPASMSAAEILREVKAIEIKAGRKDTDRWAPRALDIDILYWTDESFISEDIRIPHSSLLERPFALLPLLDVFPGAKIELPSWTAPYRTKPFNTRRSSTYFWPRFVGILNITEDSFSDGGKYLSEENLQLQYDKLLTQGADIIDIGAESTRPGAAEVSNEKEFERLSWAIERLKGRTPVSLDCRKAGVVRKILELHKIHFLNDVSGFPAEMAAVLGESGLPGFVMHSVTVPPVKDRTLDQNVNPCVQLVEWWQKKMEVLSSAGVRADQLIFDPGIGFGKTVAQNFYILQHLEEFGAIRQPVMIGHSRKSFLSALSGRPAEFRDAETALVTADLNLAYTQYLRVHDIETQKAALRC